MNAISVSNPARCYAPPLPRSRTNPGKNGRVSFAGFRSPRCALNVSIGGENYNYENIPKFTRMNVWDPYKRLGVTRDASEEEIRGARNFLLEQYAGHERSMESIEDAYEKIIMKSFRERKKTKINLKSRLKQKVEESPSWVKTLLSYVELPPADVILRRLFLFGFMGGWSIMTSAETGPAFQVALSLLSCIYFLNDKMNSVLRASATGFGALVVGWIVGSVLVPVIPSAILPPTWTLELLTSLVQFSLISVTLMTYSFNSVDKNAAVTLVFLVFLDFLLALAIMYV